MERASIGSRRSMIIVGAALVLGGVALGVWIFFRGTEPFLIDELWNTLLVDWISPVAFGVSMAMNFLGGGWFGSFALPIAIALLLLLIRRPWGAAYFISAEIASVAVVQLLKVTLGRARPEQIAVVSDNGSFPSGHVANAATIAVAAVVLFPKVWVAIVGGAWVFLMAFSRTYLHAHWLTDTLGGAMIGAGVALLVAAAYARVLVKEKRMPQIDAPQ